jgi:hypothetical protein
MRIMNSSSPNYRQPAQTQSLATPRPALYSLLLVLERWFLAWALRAEARWKTTDLRSRYY